MLPPGLPPPLLPATPSPLVGTSAAIGYLRDKGLFQDDESEDEGDNAAADFDDGRDELLKAGGPVLFGGEFGLLLGAEGTPSGLTHFPPEASNQKTAAQHGEHGSSAQPIATCYQDQPKQKDDRTPNAIAGAA